MKLISLHLSFKKTPKERLILKADKEGVLVRSKKMKRIRIRFTPKSRVHLPNMTYKVARRSFKKSS